MNPRISIDLDLAAAVSLDCGCSLVRVQHCYRYLSYAIELGIVFLVFFEP